MFSKPLRMACLALAPLAGLAQQGGPQEATAIPSLQATAGVSDCAAPAPDQLTPDEIRAQAHYRTERGTSCYQAGRCRLPNAYLYDAEIVPRVRKALLADGRFANTSIWVQGQRRWVWLKGCVQDSTQAQAAEQLVRSLDDVEAVINELSFPAPGGAP